MADQATAHATPPRPRLPTGAVPVNLAELEALLDAGATRQELRAWLARQAPRTREEGDTDAATQ